MRLYVRKDNRIKAHFLTCFLALVIYRYLEKGLNGNYSCEQLCDTLRKMNVREVLGEGYIPTYTRTDIIDALHEKFGFGRTRLDRFIHEFNFQAECLMDDYFTWEDQIEVLRKECGLDLNIRKNDKDVRI